MNRYEKWLTQQEIKPIDPKLVEGPAVVFTWWQGSWVDAREYNVFMTTPVRSTNE